MGKFHVCEQAVFEGADMVGQRVCVCVFRYRCMSVCVYVFVCLLVCCVYVFVGSGIYIFM